MIDLDPQAHLTGICNASVEASERSLYGFYSRGATLAGLIKFAPGGWKVIPSHLDLSKVDAQLGKGPQALNRLAAGIAKENLNTDRPILMDACPMLGVLSLNGVFAADRVLVPISADYLAIKGAGQMERTLRALEHVLKKRVERRYVLTRFDSRRKMSWDVEQKLRALRRGVVRDTHRRDGEHRREPGAPARRVRACAGEPRRGRLHRAARGTHRLRLHALGACAPSSCFPAC